ncbi:CBM96 family carbohydrate-binding protein [Corallococcus sp. M7]
MSGKKMWRRMRTGAGWLAGMMLLTHCGGAEERVKDGQPLSGDTGQQTAELDACEAVVQLENLRVVATEDTYAAATDPTATHGEFDRLVVDANPQTEGFLKFNVPHALLQGGVIVRAKLQLNAVDGSSDGPALYQTGTEWSEASLNWNNRPGHASGLFLGDQGSIITHQLVEYDVTPVVTEPGTFGFVLVPTSGDGTDFRSLESSGTTLVPRLDLTVAKSVCTRRGTGGDVAWTWTRGGEGTQSLDAASEGMDAAPDGSFVTLASYSGQGNFGGQTFTGANRFVIAKYAADGSHQWSRAYVPFEPDVRLHAQGITLTPLGNILVVGNYNGAPDLGAGPLPPVEDEDDVGLFIAKYSPNGDFVWARGFAPTGSAQLSQRYVNASRVTSDANGSLIVTGGFVGELNLGGDTFISGTTDAQEGLFLAKFSWEGNPLWSLAVPAGTSDPYYDGVHADAVVTDANGRVFITGVAGTGRMGATAPSTPFIAAYSPAGALLWSRAFNGATGWLESLSLMPDGNLAFAGAFSGVFSFAGNTLTSEPANSGPSSDALLGAVSASGGELWVRKYGTEKDEAFGDIGVDSAGNITVRATSNGLLDLGGGQLGHPAEGRRFVARFSASGAHLWSRVMDPDLTVTEMEVLPDGSTLLEGAFRDPVTLGAQEYLAPGGESELLFLRLTP